MVENDIKESLVLDDVFQSNLNMYQLENKKNNETDPNLWLKHNYRFILSIIISMFCIVGYLITLEGLFDIKTICRDALYAISCMLRSEYIRIPPQWV